MADECLGAFDLQHMRSPGHDDEARAGNRLRDRAGGGNRRPKVDFAGDDQRRNRELGRRSSAS